MPILEVQMKRLDTLGKYRVEVIADNSGKFCGNGVSFDELPEAHAYAVDLFSRWTLVREWRVVDSTGAVVMQSNKPHAATGNGTYDTGTVLL